MTELSLYDESFNIKGTVCVPFEFNLADIRIGVVHQVITSTLASRRGGNACNKTKAEVKGGGAKPFKQKGTGRARQGSSRSPLQVGGGSTFGPRPKDFSKKINKSMYRVAIKSILVDKYHSGKLIVAENLFKSNKTNENFKVYNSKGMLPALIVTRDVNSIIQRSTNNLSNCRYLPVNGFSVYEAIKYDYLIIEKTALLDLVNKLKGINNEL